MHEYKEALKLEYLLGFLGLKTKSWGSRQDVFVDCIKKVIIDGFWL
jgi:hypothetical protein